VEGMKCKLDGSGFNRNQEEVLEITTLDNSFNTFDVK
jgi:hypothetical protein